VSIRFFDRAAQELLKMKKDEAAPRRSQRRPATIHDVAARAGVSTATVSRTLATPDLVSDEARARVLAAIKATGYTPNVAARNLRGRRTMMVLVVVPNIANAFFAEILRGIDDELVASGYGMIIGNLDNKAEREPRYVDLVFSGQVDAVLSLSARVPTADGRKMSAAGLPMATICVGIPGSDLPFVMVDNHKAAMAAVRHLVELGHRRFGYIAGPADNINDVQRRAGFTAGLEAAGIDPRQAVFWPGDFYFDSGAAVGCDFLSRANRPTAIFAASDYMAIGFMNTVALGGVRVPKDVSIVGFDGIEFSDVVTPTLTTICQPRHELGRAGARLLLERLKGDTRPASIYLDAPLLVRESTAPPPQRAERARRRSSVPAAG
jgi:LacI family transcriptional regulator, repressor for deo operon, udp, cdd, tsx, nupC, and nupG